jgi:putative ABC transport system permease protein
MNDERGTMKRNRVASYIVHHSSFIVSIINTLRHSTMSPLTLVVRSLAYHLRINAAVALGVAAATAVLTGALLVGDSVRGSLRHLALDRLGQIESVLLTQRFFRTELADETVERIADCYRDVFPAMLLQGTLDRPGENTRRASDVTVVGADERFWRQGDVQPSRLPKLNEVVLNETLASELQTKVGDRVILRLPQPSDIPADSPLGRKTATSQSRGLTVIEIVPAESLGRFGLRPTQQHVFNAYVSIETLRDLLEQPGTANAIFVAGGEAASGDGAPKTDCQAALERALQPRLIDYGIQVAKTDRGYFHFTSDRMLIEPPAAEAILREFDDAGAQPVLVYLANYIKASKNGKEAKIPYSTIAAVDFTDESPLGPLKTIDGQTITRLDRDDSASDAEIILNSWAADDMREQGVDLQVGDMITLDFFLPETTHGNVHETSASFKLGGIVPLEGVANDPSFTPELQGVTDQESIANWDPPFPYDASRVRSVKPNDQDERYWDEYKATPKGFISLEMGQTMWGSRFGKVTSIRIPADEGMTAESLAARIEKEIDPAAMGFTFLPVKEQGLEAAAGTTSFNFLFLGFSFFIIAAAVMLIALLFKLGVDQRAAEIGLLLATGISQRKIRWLLVAEGVVVAAVGALIGTAGGIGYAWLMIYGLNHWWTAAIVTPFLDLYITPLSLIVGYVVGLLIAVLTIAWSLRQMRRASIRRLLAGQVTEERFTRRGRRAWAHVAAIAMLVVAVGILAFATQLSGEAQAGAFVGSGALVLGGLLATVWHSLGSERRAGSILSRSTGGALMRLAVRNGARAPLRSTLTIGLVATATFLIVAISAFRLDPPADTSDPRTGSGGFELIAESDQPIYQDLDTPVGRRDAGFEAVNERSVAGATVIPLRVQAGDDASCLNLYQPQQPRVVGITERLILHDGFAWGATAGGNDLAHSNPWRLLERGQTPPTEGDYEAVPVILDQNTATYSLHLDGVGDTFSIDDTRGDQVTFQVVGLLKNSVFQGDLLIHEESFKRLYPDVSGYRMFLIAKGESKFGVAALQETFESALSDYGLDVERTSDRLANFMAVQNTYLSTFQSLGGLGLLLGTFGLATVQLRNVLERRGELALMRATGFRRRRLAELVMLENAALLSFGLGTGILAAFVAILPNLLRGNASIPWLSLAGTLALVLAVGMLAGLTAVRATLRAPLLEALRGE